MEVQGVISSFSFPQQETRAKVFSEKEVAALPELSAQVTDQTTEKVEDSIDRHKLEEAVGQINKTMETYNTELRFSIHEASGEVMVQVINTEDGSVIREIPPEPILEIVAYVKKMLGIIVDKFI